jgi:DNA-binding transcriptional ArsR family regulator
MIEAFAALAEPNRFRIVELLRAGACTVNEIGQRLQLNQPQVSKHLRVLKEAGMVEVEPRAQQRLYELRAQPLREMHDWLELYRKVWDERFEALDGLLAELQSAPEPPPGPRGKRRRAGRHVRSDARATSRPIITKETAHDRRNRR